TSIVTEALLLRPAVSATLAVMTWAPSDSATAPFAAGVRAPSTSLVHEMAEVRSPSSASFAVADKTTGEKLVAPSVGLWMVSVGALLGGVQAATSTTTAKAMEARILLLRDVMLYLRVTPGTVGV